MVREEGDHGVTLGRLVWRSEKVVKTILVEARTHGLNNYMDETPSTVNQSSIIQLLYFSSCLLCPSFHSSYPVFVYDWENLQSHPKHFGSVITLLASLPSKCA